MTAANPPEENEPLTGIETQLEDFAEKWMSPKRFRSSFKRHPFRTIAAYVLGAVLLLTLVNSTIDAYPGMKDKASWSAAQIAGVAGSCTDFFDSLVSRDDEQHVEVIPTARLQGLGYQPCITSDSDTAHPGDRIMLHWSAMNIGTGALRGLRFKIFESENSEFSEFADYIPGSATMMINGEAHPLENGWEINGQEVEELAPGGIVDVEYSVRINQAAPIDEQLTLSVWSSADQFHWSPCTREISISQDEDTAI